MEILLNTFIGKWYIKRKFGLPKNAVIKKINSNSITYEIEGILKSRVYQSVFLELPIFRVLKALFVISIAYLSKGISTLSFGFVLATDTTATNNADTFIRSQTPDTNLSTDTSFFIQGDTGQTYRALLRFTLPSGTGTISDIKLFAYLFSKGTNSQSGNINAHALTRTDWVESQVTYNIYKSGNNWTTAGGDYNATVVGHIANPQTLNSWYSWGLVGATADNPLSLTWGSVVDLLLKYATEGTSSSPDDYSGFYSKEYTGDTSKRPYIEITYTATTNVTVNATVQSATLSIPATTVTAIRNATVSAGVQSATFSQPVATATAIRNATISPSAQSATFSIPAVNIITPDAQINASVLTATFSIPAPTARISNAVSQGTPPSATFSIPASTVRIGYTHASNVFSATFTVPAPTISAESNITVSPSALSATFSLPAVTVSGEQNALFEAGVLSATFSVQAPTVTAIRNITVDASVLSALFSTQTPRKVGGVWTAQPREEGVWTAQPRAI